MTTGMARTGRSGASTNATANKNGARSNRNASRTSAKGNKSGSGSSGTKVDRGSAVIYSGRTPDKSGVPPTDAKWIIKDAVADGVAPDKVADVVKEAIDVESEGVEVGERQPSPDR